MQRAAGVGLGGPANPAKQFTRFTTLPRAISPPACPHAGHVSPRASLITSQAAHRTARRKGSRTILLLLSLLTSAIRPPNRLPATNLPPRCCPTGCRRPARSRRAGHAGHFAVRFSLGVQNSRVFEDATTNARTTMTATSTATASTFIFFSASLGLPTSAGQSAGNSTSGTVSVSGQYGAGLHAGKRDSGTGNEATYAPGQSAG